MNNLSATSLTATLNPFAWMAIAFCMGTYIFTFGGLGLYALNEKRKQNKRSANVHGQQINSGILHENSIYGQLSTTVNIDGISSDTSIDEQPSAASVEAQASSSHEQSPATSEREQEFSDAAAANSVTRRARDVFSHATIPLRTLRTRRKQRAGTESQA